MAQGDLVLACGIEWLLLAMVGPDEASRARHRKPLQLGWAPGQASPLPPPSTPPPQPEGNGVCEK
jgi:hypothetical protein